MYSFLLTADKAAVAKSFSHVNERELAQMMLYLVLYRNVCAHGEKLFSHHACSDMPDTVLHAKLELSRRSQEYECGKRDLFGCVIALRYMLPAVDFLTFRSRLVSLVNRFLRDNGAMERSELYTYMGFPGNWKSVTRYRMQLRGCTAGAKRRGGGAQRAAATRNLPHRISSHAIWDFTMIRPR